MTLLAFFLGSPGDPRVTHTLQSYADVSEKFLKCPRDHQDMIHVSHHEGIISIFQYQVLETLKRSWRICKVKSIHTNL